LASLDLGIAVLCEQRCGEAIKLLVQLAILLP
jgi:hypothetical protein